MPSVTLRASVEDLKCITNAQQTESAKEFGSAVGVCHASDEVVSRA